MKFVKKEFRDSKKHGGAFVYTFEVGKQELELILAIVKQTRLNTPRVIETIPTIGRLRNMRSTIEKSLYEK